MFCCVLKWKWFKKWSTFSEKQKQPPAESFTSEEVDPTTIFTKSNESTFHTNLQSLSLSLSRCLPSISLAQGHVGPVFLPKCFLLLTPPLSELSERWLEAIRGEPIRSVCLDSDGELDAVKMRPAPHLKMFPQVNHQREERISRNTLIDSSISLNRSVGIRSIIQEGRDTNGPDQHFMVSSECHSSLSA